MATNLPPLPSLISMVYPKPQTSPKPQVMVDAEQVAAALLAKIQEVACKTSEWYCTRPLDRAIIIIPSFHYTFPSGHLTDEDQPATWALWGKLYPEAAFKHFTLCDNDPQALSIIEHALEPSFLDHLTIGRAAPLSAVVYLLAHAIQLKTLSLSLGREHKPYLETFLYLPGLWKIQTLTLNYSGYLHLNLSHMLHLTTLILYQGSGGNPSNLRLYNDTHIPATVTHLEASIHAVTHIYSLANVKTLILHGYPEEEHDLESFQSCTSLTSLEIYPIGSFQSTPIPEELIQEFALNTVFPQVTLLKLHNSHHMQSRWDQESTIEFSMNSPTLKSSFPNLSYLYINAFWDVLGHPFYGETIEEMKDEFDSSIDRYNPTWSFEIEGFVKAVKANSWKMSYMQ
ncbi:hypothetical protein PHLGIDRAFT_510710 [Phlebiopsis gigantea 11061_1 CR5-6]|uniref:Uncharacterized protein n=1 Tax=Phlebiopsis gigantea (strain 11061_1 CR5-6) TaxID=745531 RepID=A0A0C3P8X2_PHLG1|nr:hypothetical protein PHLGIDRAFT_510710 [Phlebiopsis gigantea 11061_1 CR5-6]